MPALPIELIEDTPISLFYIELFTAKNVQISKYQNVEPEASVLVARSVCALVLWCFGALFGRARRRMRMAVK